MVLSSIGVGVFTRGRLFANVNVGLKMGVFLPYLDRAFVGPHSLLRVRINYYACGWFITRANDFLRVRLLI